MTSPARAKYRRLHSDSGAEEARAQLEAGEVRERSLQSVLCLAQQELELEESEHQVKCSPPRLPDIRSICVLSAF